MGSLKKKKTDSTQGDTQGAQHTKFSQWMLEYTNQKFIKLATDMQDTFLSGVGGYNRLCEFFFFDLNMYTYDEVIL